MRRNELAVEYFNWMCDLVYDNSYSKKLSYNKLLQHLDSVDFTYILPMDSNRMYDGIDLRYRFGYDREYDDGMVAVYLDDRPCSVLEMMVALAKRCEEEIMWDPELGDRTGQWFWTMIVNLGLEHMTDDIFDEDYVDDVLHAFLNREHAYDGRGSLYFIDDPEKDLRNVEIWYQMCMYLNRLEA